ncbi:MAG: metal-dependent transcriptional regulator [Gemmatimonadales bacterium]|nr:metal-dependent transcriptional regulator [Gemmatimonadales bacterium]
MNALFQTDALTRSVEDYLKAIYRLSPGGQPAATSDIAQLLELSPPSVSGMIKRLSEQGLLEHVPYKGVLLTADGRRAALRMVRRHRVIESYLVAQLGYSWDAVHDEAERLEHAVSDALIERMSAALGNPGVDPHGDPIPTADGDVNEVVSTPLPDVPPGVSVAIVRVNAREPDRLRYLASLGLRPGVRVSVVDRQPFHGPITVRTAEGDRVLGAEMARDILCGRGEDA